MGWFKLLWNTLPETEVESQKIGDQRYKITTRLNGEVRTNTVRTFEREQADALREVGKGSSETYVEDELAD